MNLMTIAVLALVVVAAVALLQQSRVSRDNFPGLVDDARAKPPGTPHLPEEARQPPGAIGAATPGRVANAIGVIDGAGTSNRVDDSNDKEEVDLPEEAPETLAVTTSGEAFYRDSEGVWVVPLGRVSAPTGMISSRPFASLLADDGSFRNAGPERTLFAEGDFIAARVAPGTPAVDPWRLEALGAHGEYMVWAFATEASAKLALSALTDARVVTAPRSEDGEVATATNADFDEARRGYETAIAELAAMPEAAEEEAVDEEGESRDAERALASGGEVVPHETRVDDVARLDSVGVDRSATAERTAATAATLDPETESRAESQADGESESESEPEPEADNPGYLPSSEAQEWLTENLADLIRRAGAETFLCAPLVTPTDHYFPDRWTPDAEGAQRIAARLLGYAGLSGLRPRVILCDRLDRMEPLEPGGEVPPRALRDGGFGCFAGIHEESCVFGLEEHTLQDPEGLVATLCHEVAHAWRAVKGLVGADSVVEEALADLTTVYLGLGLLYANAHERYLLAYKQSRVREAVRLTRERAGYLDPESLCFLLAIQAVCCDLPADTVRRWLDPNHREFFAAAIEALQGRREKLLRRLALPPEAEWPELWPDTPAKA